MCLWSEPCLCVRLSNCVCEEAQWWTHSRAGVVAAQHPIDAVVVWSTLMLNSCELLWWGDETWQIPGLSDQTNRRPDISQVNKSFCMGWKVELRASQAWSDSPHLSASAYVPWCTGPCGQQLISATSQTQHQRSCALGGCDEKIWFHSFFLATTSGLMRLSVIVCYWYLGGIHQPDSKLSIWFLVRLKKKMEGEANPKCKGETLGLTKSTFRLLLPVPAGQGCDQGAVLPMQTPFP